jgi:putative ABC transport system ATP-binding protein
MELLTDLHAKGATILMVTILIMMLHSQRTILMKDGVVFSEKIKNCRYF